MNGKPWNWENERLLQPGMVRKMTPGQIDDSICPNSAHVIMLNMTENLRNL